MLRLVVGGVQEGDWSSEYDLVIAKEPAPDAPKLASLIVDGREIEPVGSLYSISVDHDASDVAVTASAGADVEIELAGVRQFGSVEAFIPITDDEMSLPIRQAGTHRSAYFRRIYSGTSRIWGIGCRILRIDKLERQELDRRRTRKHTIRLSWIAQGYIRKVDRRI